MEHPCLTMPGSPRKQTVAHDEVCQKQGIPASKEQGLAAHCIPTQERDHDHACASCSASHQNHLCQAGAVRSRTGSEV